MAKKKGAVGALDTYIDSRFGDWGIRDYLYRVFWDDYPLKRDIELAGNISESAALERDIRRIEKPVGTGNDADKEYNALVQNLNRIAERPNDAWDDLQDNVLEYFDSDLSIYEDRPGNNLSTPCYLLNTENGDLRYFDGADSHAVCNFSNSKMPRVQEILPALFVQPVLPIELFQKRAPLKAETFVSLIALARSVNRKAVFHIPVETSFISLFTRLVSLTDRRAARVKQEHTDHRDANEIVADLVERMQERITAYLEDEKKHTNEAKKIVMENIKSFLETGNADGLDGAIRTYDKGWLSWIASWFFASEADKTYKAIMGMRSSPFFEKALAHLIATRDTIAGEKEPSVAQLRGDLSDLQRQNQALEAALAQYRGREDEAGNREHEFDSHITDFEGSERAVNEVWKECKVTKAAMTETLDKMLQHIREFQTENRLDLPEIVLPPDILSAEETPPDKKTVIAHIEDCIIRLQEKIAADKTSSFVQADCILLQNSINKILNHRHFGEDTRKRVPEAQRRLYVGIGNTLTDDLNKTTRQPSLKAAEVLNSVVSVRAEIHRLMEFHNKIRAKLTEFQNRLDKIDQATFADSLDTFVEGPLKERQAELQLLLDRIGGCPDAAFNVLVPQQSVETKLTSKSGSDPYLDPSAMTNQEKVCEVVMKLQEFQTSMVDALLEPLLQDEDGDERTYIQIDRRNDEGNADIFAGIMQDVRTYADTLPDEEASKLETFFAESAVQEPLHAPGEFGMFGGGGDFVGPSAPVLGAGLGQRVKK
ncbi:MAG: hypothetical protein NTU48_05715 [Legionellales bacterium]|nr:hypothetical protein [Legionellales bacterium]